MTTEPGSGRSLLPGSAHHPSRSPGSAGDGFEGGCLTLLAVLIEIPAALVMALSLGMRGLAQSANETNESPGHVGTPPMDWVPVLWLGGFTLAVLVVAGLFLRSGHPFAGSFQLLIGAVVLTVTIAVGTAEYERAHPAPLPRCPTQAGVPCAPQNPTAPPGNDRGSTGHQCRSGGDSDECADSGR
ncbi:DUF6234 family protein [Streptomyces sp. NPDC001876]|uniref:DUF6234 family protein n=1 Tax=Streptomyces sp. NPDC001876 TaxID=3154402 RepID=UPI003322C386